MDPKARLRLSYTMRLITPLLGSLLVASVASAQDGPTPKGYPLSTDGTHLASLQWDSVFVSRQTSETFLDGGAWGSYVMAEMGVIPIPDDLRFRVSVEPSHMELFGTIADLPLETRQVLAPILGFFSPETSLIARIEMHRWNAEVIDLRLVSLAINGREFPETALALFLAQIGKQYPVLTETGRNLRLEVPRTGLVELEAGGVRLRMVDRR